MTYSYTQLRALLDEIALEAITAALNADGWAGTAQTGFKKTGGGTVQSAILLPPARPGLGPHPAIQTGTRTFDYYGECYAPWFNRVNQIFETWQNLPEPSDFGQHIAASKQAAVKLNPANAPVQRVESNTELSDLDTVGQQLSDYTGGAIYAFTDNYWNKIPGVLQGQAATAMILLSILEGEKELWTRARENTAALCANALAQLKAGNTPQGDPASPAATAAVVGALLGIVAVGVPVIGWAAAGFGLVAALMAFHESSEPEAPSVDGGTPEAVLDSLEAALGHLDADISSEEFAAERLLNAAIQDIYSDRENHFNLLLPGEFTGSDDRSDLFGPDFLTLDLTGLRRIATEDVPNVARQFRHSARNLAGAVGEGGWARSTPVGYTSKGPYDAWQQLNALLQELTTNTAAELDAAATHLEIATQSFGDVDSELAANLAQLRVAIDTEPQRPPPPPPGGNTPTPV